MNLIVKIILLLCLGVGGNLAVFAAETTENILKEAKSELQKADKLNGAWLTTTQLIKNAENALAAHQKDKALKLAIKARMEASLSYIQAKDQLKNWREPAYIRGR